MRWNAAALGPEPARRLPGDLTHDKAIVLGAACCRTDAAAATALCLHLNLGTAHFEDLNISDVAPDGSALLQHPAIDPGRNGLAEGAPVKIPACARPILAAHLAYRLSQGAAGSDPYFTHPRDPGSRSPERILRNAVTRTCRKIGYEMPWMHGGDCRYGADIGLTEREPGWLAERGLSLYRIDPAIRDRVPQHGPPRRYRPGWLDEPAVTKPATQPPPAVMPANAVSVGVRFPATATTAEPASTWRNPEEDLPSDFEANRDVHYEALKKPRDPAEFIAHLKKRHTAALTMLNKALTKGTTGGVKITTKKGEPWISVPPVAKQPEPENLAALKAEIGRRWGVIDLLNLLKDVDHITHYTADFTSVASRTVTDTAVLQRRLLLCLYGLGTNVGIKRVADGVAAAPDADDADTEAALPRTRRMFINWNNLRVAIRTIVNKTLEARDTSPWGPGTSCASDSRKFGSWSANFMTEWHQRYGGPGIMVYWHVERRSVCIYSQVTSTTASEVASMIEGLLRHLTSAEIDRQYTDTHGASIVGFAFAHLLDFQLLPRLKNIGSARLYRPGVGEDEAWPELDAVLSNKTIDWDLLASNYDVMVKYATALRLKTAEAHQMLRRFTRGGPKHPTYQAIEELRQEIHEGLNVVENWNSANKDIFYGKAGDLTGDDRESVEIPALALHLVQAAIGYLNTQMIQIVLRDEAWRGRLTDTDLRGLSALFWGHLNLYGRFDLDMTRFMDLEVGEPAA